MSYEKKLARPVWAEIDLSRFRENIERLQKYFTPENGIMAVIKADAYGHGAAALALEALKQGIQWFGLASLEEVESLRKQGVGGKMLVLGPTPASCAARALEADCRLALCDEKNLEAYSDIAKSLGKSFLFHLKVDTGMSRLGVSPGEAMEILREIKKLPGLEVEGIFSHYACADSDDASFERQTQIFKKLCSELDDHSLLPPIEHMENSSAFLRKDAPKFSLARLGLAIYGENPMPCGVISSLKLSPVMSWKCKVIQVRACPKGSPVSYGSIYRTKESTRLAVLPVGYADGYFRGLSELGEVLWQGKRIPVRGRICMDMTIIEDSSKEIEVGDEVVLLGRQGKKEISAFDISQKIHSIPYEVMTSISSRIPRHYCK